MSLKNYSAVLLTLLAASPLAATAQQTPGDAPTPATPHQACAETTVALTDTVDSRTAKPGDVFRFTTIQDVTINGHSVPAGSTGAGTIAISNHARGGGRAGNLVVEPRYILAADGTRIPVSFEAGRIEGAARGGSANAPFVLAFVPFVGVPAQLYNGFHHGKEAAILAGTRFDVIVNADAPAVDCKVATR